MAATPVNKTNYVKGKFYDEIKSFQELWDDLDDNVAKHFANQGPYNIPPKSYNAEITITETSPAACIVKLEMKS